ncbi:hypothetical protein FHW88_005083 [Mucilaginibacter sp. SG538B]|uniref:hypothetical protein n=1 Tax=Mucilaginibacter sp. SG538B TaxID=2587021 RepID=UPI00159E8CAF|nr:hypothetical protein [Mucilaginibacter sp. SG538B]NVM66765.1 hypothetical protein [Mucilaginibacter sp. SG538B]
MKLNIAWHLANPMPKYPTLEERITWHTAHQVHRGCRPVPRSVEEKIKKRASQ